MKKLWILDNHSAYNSLITIKGYKSTNEVQSGNYKLTQRELLKQFSSLCTDLDLIALKEILKQKCLITTFDTCESLIKRAVRQCDKEYQEGFLERLYFDGCIVAIKFLQKQFQ